MKHYDKHRTLAFDADFYNLQLSGRRLTKHECLDHFFDKGIASGLDPHPLIRTTVFLSENKKGRTSDKRLFETLFGAGRPGEFVTVPAIFDEAHYRQQLDRQEIEAENIFVHYHTTGRYNLLSPNPLFDPRHYRRQTGIGRSDAIDPFESYIRRGWKTGLSPHPVFDTDYYATLSKAAQKVPALLHYLYAGWKDGLSPCKFFDPEYYEYSCERSLTTPPLLHYLKRFDWNCCAHYLFSDQFYCSSVRNSTLKSGELRSETMSPLEHFVRFGKTLNIPTHPLFDQKHYREQFERLPLANDDRNWALSTNLLEHYLDVGRHCRLDPSPYIDVDYLAKASGDPNEDPVRWYLLGGYEEHSSHPAIDIDYYALNATDFSASEQIAILHLLSTPKESRVSPHPLFNRDYYIDANFDLKENGICPVLHFIEHGVSEGRSPNPFFSHHYAHSVETRAEKGFHDPLPAYLRNHRQRQKALLFLGHEAALSGAPLILLNIIKRISENTDFQCYSVLGAGGPLVDEFGLYSHTYVMSDWDRGFLDWRKHSNKFLFEAEQLRKTIGELELAGIFANSVESRHLADYFARSGFGPIMTLVHEAADSFENWQLTKLFEISDMLIYPSNYTLKRSRRAVDVPMEKVKVRGQGLLIDGFGKGNRKLAKERVCKKLGIPPDAKVVVGCGTINTRKGTDLFVDAACRYLKKSGDHGTHFLWIGEGATQYDSVYAWAQMQIADHGFEQNIHFVGPHRDNEDFYLAGDLFALTSRIDPFPCVVHEAMACGLPVVMFEGTNGSIELAGDSALVIDKSAEQLAAAISELLNDPKRIKAMGQRAVERIETSGSFDAYVQDLLGYFEQLTDSDVHEVSGDYNFAPAIADKKTVYFMATDWEISGVNTFTENLVRSLNERGFDAKLLFTLGHTFKPDPAVEEPPFPDVPYHFLQPDSEKPADRWEALRSFFTSNRDYCVLVPNYDFIGASVIPTLPPHVRTVGILHSDDIEHYELGYRIGPYYDRIVCVSQRICDRIVDLNRSFKSKTSIIPYGITGDKPKASAAARRKRSLKKSDPIRLIYVGRVVEKQKKISNYVKLANLLHQERIPFELVIVGDGAELTKTKLSLSPFVDDGRVRFADRLKPDEVLDEFANADLFVLLSEFEGLPLSLLEATSLGCVPMAWNIESGIPEAIRSGDNGFVFRKNDFKALVEKIRELQADKAALRKVSNRVSRSFADSPYQLSVAVARYAEIFDSIFEHRDKRDLERPMTLTYYHDGIARPIWLED